FGGGVRRERLHRQVFGLAGRVGGAAVGTGAGGVDDPADPGPAGGVEDVQRAGGAGPVADGRRLDAAGHRGERPEVVDDAGPRDRPRDGVRVGQVAGDDLGGGSEAVEVGADKAGAAGDQAQFVHPVDLSLVRPATRVI